MRHTRPPVCLCRAFTAGLVLLLLPLAAGAATAEGPDTAAAALRQAGTLEDDLERVACLERLQARPDLDPRLKADLERFLPEARRWAGGHGAWLAYFGKAIGSGTRDYDLGLAEDSPLYPLGCLYRARMLIWYAVENGDVWSSPERRPQYLGKARELLETARRAFPESRLIGMYLGVPIPPARTLEPVPGAPEWASLEREGLERLADIVQWWIDHRQQADGQYGGGWGDDCEMWRWWTPVLIAFDDPAIGAAQTRFSEALLGQPHMRGGYTSVVTDVEHTAEDSADAITPMMHLAPDAPVWQARARRLTELMENLWTGRNDRGGLQFKSTYFSVDRVDPNPQRACDTVYHPRAVQPSLLYWQRTGDPAMGSLFTRWLDTWVAAALSQERGKPAGVIPTAIHWPDGAVGGLGPDWWDPRNHSETTLYRWPSATPMLASSLLLAYHMTQERKYLEPLLAMAALRLDVLRHPPAAEPAAGSAAWCGQRLGFLTGIAAKYRLLTGGPEFDDLLALDPGPYMAFRLRGDQQPLTEALRTTAEALRLNFAGYTSEVRYTDRVLRFPTLFDKGVLLDAAVPAIRKPSPGLLFSCATGDPGDPLYFPLAAVRWLTPPRDLAARVTDSGRNRFAAELFHFGPAPRPMAAELYLLTAGRYVLTLTPAGGAPAAPQAIAVSGARTRVPFLLPARQLCGLQVRRAD